MRSPLNSSERIAVVTAANPGYKNTGMVTVDLAFEAIRRRLGDGIRASWYSLYRPTVIPLRDYVRENDLPFRVQPLAENLDQLYEYDAVVFWGDFLHTRHYIEQDAPTMSRILGLMSDREEARQLLHRSLLLRDAPEELLSRTVLYGGTILHNSQADYADRDYGSAFTRLITQSHSVWMREPISAAKVAHLREDEGSAHFGADAALLLRRPDDLAALPATGWAGMIPSNEVIGVYLGGRTEIPSWLPSFCRRLAARLDTRLEWLPWFDVATCGTLDIETRAGHYTVGDILASLSRYRLIITDTYHLCVNAWRSGTPVVCIGSPQPVDSSAGGFRSLNDLKKHVFHLAYDAGDFYVSTARGTSAQHREHFERLVQLLDGGFKPVVQRMHHHAERSEAALNQTLTSILYPPSR